MINKTQGYATSLYAKMDEEAEHGADGVIWKGKLVETCVSVGIPIGGYNRAINYLRKAGCVEQLARGSAVQPSIFRLDKPPTPEVLEEAFVKSRDRALTKAPNLDILSQQLRDIQKLVGGVNIADALENLDRRISLLERLLGEQTARQDSNTTTIQNNKERNTNG